MSDDETQVEEILLRAAAELAALDDYDGMPATVVIAYAAMDGAGETYTGDAFCGSEITAIGLLEATKHRLLAKEYE